MLTPDRTPTFAVDTVVIGGGLAGLVAANHLADSGTTVTVIEARSAVGGRASTTERDGFLFNEGPHALYRGGVGTAALGELGIEAAGGMPSVTKSYGLSNGRVSCLPASFMTLLRTKLVPLSLKPKLAITMAGLSKVEPSELATTTVTQWIEATTANPEMRSLLHALSRLATYSHAPELLSAEIAVRQIQMAMKDNVLYLDGGWQQLVTALANRAAAAGATITTGVKVTAIGSVQNGWVVETDGGQIAAQAVIAAAGGPEQAESWFGLGPGKLTRAAGPKVQAAVLDVLLKRLPERRFVLGIDEPVYFSVHGPPAQLAPAGCAAAVAARYLAPDDDGDSRPSLDAITTAAGVTADDVVNVRHARRLTVVHGMALAERGGLAGRPGVNAPGQPGAFVAGDWVGARGWLADAALDSGKQAAAAALSHLRQSPVRIGA